MATLKCKMCGGELELTQWLPRKTKVYENGMQNAQVGDIVCLGTYEQDNNIQNGKEAVEWLVLKKEDNRALVISKYVLDAQPLFKDLSASTLHNWEQSSLRSWLNSTFFVGAFSEVEQKHIMQTKVSTLMYDEYEHEVGYGMTIDRIFLLSTEETESYFGEFLNAKTTPYGLANGLTIDKNKGDVSWWLRTPSTYGKDGWAYENSSYSLGQKKTQSYGVRPAIWIDLGM